MSDLVTASQLGAQFKRAPETIEAGQKQEGVNCAIFRNESEHLSSRLIREADSIADDVWTDRRHYTYVRREAVASNNPGYCFIAAGWKPCGYTKSGLRVLERVA